MNKYYVITVIDANGEQVLTSLYKSKEKAIALLIADYEEELQNTLNMGEKVEDESGELKSSLEEYGEYSPKEFGTTYYIHEVVLRD